ncbi:DUF6438 domain-containing protein [Pontibacter rugosus]
MARYKVLLLLCNMVMLFMLSCCTSIATKPDETAQPVLHFQKTPCFGTCPAYDATFYADGSISYNGYRNAPVQGEQQLVLNHVQLRRLYQQIEQLNYMSFKDTYTSTFTDQPATYLTFYQEGTEVKK